MIVRGQVNGRGEAMVTIRVRGPAGTMADVPALLDTGFNGMLSLSATTVGQLGLPSQSVRTVRLGDGTVRQIDLYAAEVDWANVWRPVMVHQAGREALLGTRLLSASRCTIEWWPGGTVEIATPRP